MNPAFGFAVRGRFRKVRERLPRIQQGFSAHLGKNRSSCIRVAGLPARRSCYKRLWPVDSRRGRSRSFDQHNPIVQSRYWQQGRCVPWMNCCPAGKVVLGTLEIHVGKVRRRGEKHPRFMCASTRVRSGKRLRPGMEAFQWARGQKVLTEVLFFLKSPRLANLWFDVSFPYHLVRRGPEDNSPIASNRRIPAMRCGCEGETDEKDGKLGMRGGGGETRRSSSPSSAPYSALGYWPPVPETITFPGMGLPKYWSSLETYGGLLH